MTEEELYLFDLQGYLVVENALSSAEVRELNRLIDAQNLPEPTLDGGKGHMSNFLTWGKPFCDLLDHPSMMPYLKVILGDGFRLDHYYGIYLKAGANRLRLHGGHTPYDPPEYYHFHDRQMHNGLVVVTWNLAEAGPEHGGFCCIPGSHKANYPVPQSIRDAHDKAGCVVIPKAGPGSMLIFTEALTHGTSPWWASHQRRSLLYKYSPAQQSWGKAYLQPAPELELTPRQKLLFEPPYFNDRPSLFTDES